MSYDAAPFALKQTNVSRPQLLHVNSKQSITASEDYYSVASSLSSEGDSHLHAANRSHTPPSQYRTPRHSSEYLHQAEYAIPSLRNQKFRDVSPLRVAPAASNFDEKQVRRKPVPSSSRTIRPESQRLLMMNRESNSTTPGVDTTPYIHFAIDQLTRDEEVRGSRRYPVERGGGVPQAGGLTQGSGAHQYKVQQGRVPVHQYPVVERTAPVTAIRHVEPERLATPPDRHPMHTHPPSPSPAQRDTFVPFYPPKDQQQYPPLTFIPGILRPARLLIFILLCLLMLAALIFCAIWSLSHNGLWNYGVFEDIRYFVWQYLPTLLGMFLLMWLFQIEKAVQRISPFMALASPSSRSRNQGTFMHLTTTQFLYPRAAEHFKAGQPLIGIFFLISWMFLFTVPLLASTFNVRFYGPPGTGVWRWVADQGVIWTVIALYILMIASLILLAISLWRAQTGLKWDPRSIADIIALLERSNIMNDYSGSETFSGLKQFRTRLANRTDRLGYWHTSRRTQDVFYGIGEEGAPTRRYSVEQGKIREKAPERSLTGPDHDTENGDRMDLRSPSVRRRYLPWFLKDTFVVLWIIAALALLIAFFVVSFVNHAVHNGFSPQLRVAPSSHGFSAANFTYSFIPALIGMLLYLLFQALDLSFRRLAPYHALTHPNGAPASHSLLLDYPHRHPISVTLAALSNGHIRVALLSFLSFTYGLTIPVLSGGFLWAQTYPSDNSVRIAASLTGLYALCFFLALYALSLFLIWPTRKRMALPHAGNSLAGVISWLYMSHLLSDREFKRCNTKTDLVTRLVGAPSPVQHKGFLASLTSLASRNKSKAAIAESQRPQISAPILQSTSSERVNAIPMPSQMQHQTQHQTPMLIQQTHTQQLPVPPTHTHLMPSGPQTPYEERDVVTGIAAIKPAPQLGILTPEEQARLVGGGGRRRDEPHAAVPNKAAQVLGQDNAPRHDPFVNGHGQGHSGHHDAHAPSDATTLHPPAGDAEKKERNGWTAPSPLHPEYTRYGFGVFIGRDGREHLGIDRVSRVGLGDMEIV